MTASLYPADFHQRRRAHAACRILGSDLGLLDRVHTSFWTSANRELGDQDGVPETEVLRRQAEAAQQQ
jgi:hypothetical protein